MYLSFSVLAVFGLAAFVLALYRPHFAILLPVVFHSTYLIKSSLGIIPTTGLEVLIIATVAPVLFLKRSEILGFIKERKIFLVLALIFIFSSTVSAIIAPHAHTAWGAWKALILEPIIYAIVLVSISKNKNKIIYSILIGALFSAILSSCVANWGEGFDRLRGIYDVSNSLALIVAPAFVLSVVLILLERKKIYWLSSLILGMVLLATQSLSGLFSVVVTSGLAFVLVRARKVATAFIILLILIGLIWQFNSGKLAYLLNGSSSVIARKQIWAVSLLLVKENALWGTGLGTFEPAYQAELRNILGKGGKILGSDKPLEWVVRDPHNIFLSFWLNTGLLGLTSMCALAVVGLKNFIKKIKFKPTSLLAAAFSFILLLIFGLADVPYWKNDLALVWWVLLSLLW